MKKKVKVALGLSGGVDSAVSAYLLKKQGFDVSGCYLDCFDDDAPGCRGKQDRQDALSVALHLKIPFQVLDFRRQYKAAVIGYFKKEYLAGRTPNPDVICNRDIKFGLLLDWCIKNGFDYLATGHYARLVTLADSQKSRTNANNREPTKLENFVSFVNFRDFREALADTQSKPKQSQDSVFLTQPKDLHKDQTYFLWAVPRQNFSRVLFPLANYLKSEVRAMASRLAPLRGVAAKPDSTGICFIGEVRVEDFLKRLGVREKRGEVVIKKSSNSKFQIPNSKQSQNPNDQNSKHLEHSDLENSKLFGACNLGFGASANYFVIGRHKGVWFYTVGQRHGFTINPKGPNCPPLYVIAKDVRRNRLIVGFGAETYRSNFEVSDCNWLVSEKDSPSGSGRTVLCRIRHGGELIPCEINASTHQRINVSLRFAQRGIAPGQSAVFYSKDGLVLGGGVIC